MRSGGRVSKVVEILWRRPSERCAWSLIRLRGQGAWARSVCRGFARRALRAAFHCAGLRRVKMKGRPNGTMLLCSHRLFGGKAAPVAPSRRTPIATRTEILVARLSIRALTTVPSRITRMMSSATRLRAHHASQPDFTNAARARLTSSLARLPSPHAPGWTLSPWSRKCRLVSQKLGALQQSSSAVVILVSRLRPRSPRPTTLPTDRACRHHDGGPAFSGMVGGDSD